MATVTSQMHQHRTAKVVELVCTSTKSFEDAIRCAIEDASASTRGINGAHVEGFSVKCENGKVTQYRVDLKVAFGIERTPSPQS
jgi:dodecin